MAYVPLYTPVDLSESAFIDSILKASGVRYHIRNEFGSQLDMLSTSRHGTFFVHPADFDKAYEILEDFFRDNPEYEDERFRMPDGHDAARLVPGRSDARTNNPALKTGSRVPMVITIAAALLVLAYILSGVLRG